MVLLWLGGLIFSQPNGIPQEELKTTLPLDCSFVGGGGGAGGGRERGRLLRETLLTLSPTLSVSRSVRVCAMCHACALTFKAEMESWATKLLSKLLFSLTRAQLHLRMAPIQNQAHPPH